jgi:hypothetical protein
MTTLLTDPAQVRRMLGVPTVAPGELSAYSDEAVSDAIEQASAWVFEYTGAAEAALIVDPDAPEPEAKPVVQRATTALAAYWLRQEGGAPGNDFQSDQRRDGSGYAMPTSTMQLLAPFRVMSFGSDG